jgi:DNA-binding response OmpR family regulator
MKVLVASSDALLRRRFTSWLASASHTIVEAAHANAVCNLVDHGPEVVILDWSIGGGGGAALLKFLRTFDPHSRHYVIVVCSHRQTSPRASPRAPTISCRRWRLAKSSSRGSKA